MSRKTIYTCDKCKSEQLTPEQFWTVGVQANHYPTASGTYDFVEGKKLEVCRPCLESFGIYVRTRENEPKPTVPTVEELIRQILELVQP